ncbi:MAG: STAS domain-containing protein [Gaiellaceae bacterium]
MEATEFAASARRQDGVAVLELSGDVSAGAESELQLAYGQVATEPVVVLDFAAVDYINSTGIALIVGLLAQARKSGQEVRARGLAQHYREIFRITRLSDFMTILDEEEAE